VSRYVLHHRHEPAKCSVAFASFRGYATPLRHRRALASCADGGHDIWWVVEADSPEAALGLLPHYIATRTTVTPIREVQIP
jgi:hypothetical protein